MASLYVFQEFPRILHGVRGEILVVGDELAKRAALAEGWRLVPCVDGTGNPTGAPESVDAPEDAMDVIAPDLPRRPGRPRKVTHAESV